jgi:hypothetical protein
VEPAGELLFVVPGDRRVVLGDQPAQPDVGSRLAVGQVVGDLAGGPAVGWPAIDLVGRDAGQGLDNVVETSSEAVKESSSVHVAQGNGAAMPCKPAGTASGFPGR